jgi:hypothetical protein
MDSPALDPEQVRRSYTHPALPVTYLLLALCRQVFLGHRTLASGKSLALREPVPAPVDTGARHHPPVGQSALTQGISLMSPRWPWTSDANAAGIGRSQHDDGQLPQLGLHSSGRGGRLRHAIWAQNDSSSFGVRPCHGAVFRPGRRSRWASRLC